MSLVVIGYKAVEAKGKPRPPWEVEIISDESANLVGVSDEVSDTGFPVFDDYQGDDDEFVGVGTIHNTFILAFENDPQSHIISFPGLVFNPQTAEVTEPFCEFPVYCGVEALECLSCFMGKDHTLEDYNLYIRVYTIGDPPVEIEDMVIGEDSELGGALIELIGHDTGGTVHDVECRTTDEVFITRTGADEWETWASDARLECKEQYWEITQHPKNKNKFTYERIVSVTAETDFTFNAIWTKTK